jgi:hypothetical protein
MFLCNVFSNNRRVLAENALWTCGSQFAVSHAETQAWTQGQCFFVPNYLFFFGFGMRIA